ncbi:hypothetical protein HXX76_001210 [Chlamydomonas incerta]|uniref:Uncharacterized protein n=1 Tax=Chlamydomonas incerta TaxID=51695 RepID=A0A836B164_CHLIN|nr:hypothetical protein HXX76_001210 [Chlamydomonas incerta]|eukprot:KAG2444457.1 hypothetical protein HXX76_001210 [Chlamydomonas incerta]
MQPAADSASCGPCLDRTERGTFLHCHERRELFKLCTDREPEKVSTTSIETREPLLDGHTLVATPSTRFELTPPRLESPASTSDAADATTPQQQQQLAQQLQLQAQRPPSPGRFSHPWRVHADDGGLGDHAGAGWARARAESGDMSSTSAASSSASSGFSSSCGGAGGSCSTGGGGGVLLTPQVGQAMDDIFLFADEMQRELAQHGLQLMRRGEEEEQRRKQQPGFLARLFGAREALSEGMGCGGVAPLRSSNYSHQSAAAPPAGGAAPR